MVYQQMVGIPKGTNCAPRIADLFLFCYETDFKSNLQKSKQYDQIDMYNDTSRYLDDIFTIDNPEFEKHIPDIYWAKKESIHFCNCNHFFIRTKLFNSIRIYYSPLCQL